MKALWTCTNLGWCYQLRDPAGVLRAEVFDYADACIVQSLFQAMEDARQ